MTTSPSSASDGGDKSACLYCFAIALDAMFICRAGLALPIDPATAGQVMSYIFNLKNVLMRFRSLLDPGSIGGDVAPDFDSARWPGDLEAVDPVGLAEPEMNSTL
jgi:hypothetical protein